MLFATEKDRLSGFYEKALSKRLLYSDDEHDVLNSADFQFIIHALPAQIADSIHISDPPVLSEKTRRNSFYGAELAERSVSCDELRR